MADFDRNKSNWIADNVGIERFHSETNEQFGGWTIRFQSEADAVMFKLTFSEVV